MALSIKPGRTKNFVDFEKDEVDRKNEKILASLKATLTTAKAVAGFTPVPGLSKAIQALLTIITVYETGSRNKEQILELKDYVETFVTKIITPIAVASKANTNIALPSDIQERLESLSRRLVILALHTKNLNISIARRFVRSKEIPGALDALNSKLGAAIRGFWGIRPRL